MVVECKELHRGQVVVVVHLLFGLYAPECKHSMPVTWACVFQIHDALSNWCGGAGMSPRYPTAPAPATFDPTTQSSSATIVPHSSILSS